jgi:hypothetical protein
MLTANLNTQLVSENVKMHPVLFRVPTANHIFQANTFEKENGTLLI